jgi:ribonuclease Z
LTSVAVRRGGAVYLCDCGEGTQLPYAVHHVGLRALRLVALTHLHAEQVLGLPGLLARRAQVAEAGPLTIVGPVGVAELLVPLLRGLGMRIPYELRFVELSPDDAPGKKAPLPAAYQDEQLVLRWIPLERCVPCVAFRFEEHPSPGKFSAAKARKLGLTPGPLFGKLQTGQVVTAPDGSLVEPSQVLGPPRAGRVLVYASDTAPCPGLYRLLDGVDLAVLGGGYLPDHEDDAARAQRLSLRDAARICGRSKVRGAVFTQLDVRYGDELLAEADAIAAGFSDQYRLGRTGERVEIAFGP